MSENNIHHSFKLKMKGNNKLFIFIVCLFIASSLWFINAMQKQYENYVMIPVQFTNFPKNKTLVNDPPKKLRAKIKARGFTLLQYKINASIYPINFNLRSFTNNKLEKENVSEFIILTDNYVSQITDQLNAEIQIIDLSPDSLIFKFDNIVETKKKVASNLDLSFEKQYFLCDSIHFTPEYVTVKGPSSITDTMKFIYTETQKFKNLNATTKKSVSLQEIDQIEIFPEKVTAEIPVSQYTEYSDKVTVVKMNVPDSLIIVTFPGKIDINCVIALNQYKNISASSFVIGIDYNDLNPDSKLLPVKIFKTPLNAKILSIQPPSVEYIIEKK